MSSNITHNRISDWIISVSFHIRVTHIVTLRRLYRVNGGRRNAVAICLWFLPRRTKFIVNLGSFVLIVLVQHLIYWFCHDSNWRTVCSQKSMILFHYAMEYDRRLLATVYLNVRTCVYFKRLDGLIQCVSAIMHVAMAIVNSIVSFYIRTTSMHVGEHIFWTGKKQHTI